jgi:hypothetical protein
VVRGYRSLTLMPGGGVAPLLLRERLGVGVSHSWIAALVTGQTGRVPVTRAAVSKSSRVPHLRPLGTSSPRKTRVGGQPKFHPPTSHFGEEEVPRRGGGGGQSRQSSSHVSRGSMVQRFLQFPRHCTLLLHTCFHFFPLAIDVVVPIGFE